MYYNIKHKRVGNVFVKPFRSKHVADDVYFKHVVNYIHLNPAELYEPEWKEGRVKNIEKLEHSLRTYRFSSLADYQGIKRIERILLDPEAIDLGSNTGQSLSELLGETRDFYKEYESDF